LEAGVGQQAPGVFRINLSNGGEGEEGFIKGRKGVEVRVNSSQGKEVLLDGGKRSFSEASKKISTTKEEGRN